MEAEIDGDLLSHVPVWMLQRLRQRCLFDIGTGPGPERSAGCGNDDADQFLPIAGPERLKQRVMLEIRWQDAGPGLCGALHEEITRTDEAFLVGERHRGAAVNRRKRGLQAGGAAHRGHHPIRRTRRSFDHRTFARAAFDARTRQGVLQFGQASGIGDRRVARANSRASFASPCTLALAVKASTR